MKLGIDYNKFYPLKRLKASQAKFPTNGDLSIPSLSLSRYPEDIFALNDVVQLQVVNFHNLVILM